MEYPPTIIHRVLGAAVTLGSKSHTSKGLAAARILAPLPMGMATRVRCPSLKSLEVEFLTSRLAVVGLSQRTSRVEVRERFWISEGRRYEALNYLARADGIEEVVILATCNRAEFILGASDFSRAAGSVFGFLTGEYGLKAEERHHFYETEGSTALEHVRYRNEFGPLMDAEERAIETLRAQLIRRTSSSLARELKGAFEKPANEESAAVARHLLQLQRPQVSFAERN